MSFATDDLTPLLAAGPDAGVGYRQGVVVAWDQNTAENVISVGGTNLTNLPILNTSEAVTLTPGAVVMLLTIKAQMFILGRVTIPGTTDAATSLAIDRTTAAYDTSADTVTVFPGFSNLGGPQLDVLVGKTGRLMVTVGCQMDYAGTSGSATVASGRMSYAFSGANTLASANDHALVGRTTATFGGGVTGTVTGILRASYTHFHTGLNPGLTTVTCQYSKADSTSTTSVSDRTLVVMPY